MTGAAGTTTAHQPRWELFDHDADVGVRGFGPTRASAFEQAALALTAAIVDPSCVAALSAVSVECDGVDDELLLFDWLNELIFATVTRGMLFSRFEVRIDGRHLQGTAWGQPVDEIEEAPAVEPKGATQTALTVREVEPGFWRAQCVVDV